MCFIRICREIFVLFLIDTSSKIPADGEMNSYLGLGELLLSFNTDYGWELAELAETEILEMLIFGFEYCHLFLIEESVFEDGNILRVSFVK